MKIAVYQMHTVLGAPGANMEKAEKFLRDAAGRGADLAMLPEMWPTGFDLRNVEKHLADPAHAAIPARLAALAKEMRIDVMTGSMLSAGPAAGRARNTAHYVSRDGETLASYSKMHLYPPMLEDQYLAPGDAHEVFKTRFCASAMAICYDLRFPELFRRCALDGARLMLVSAAWPAGHVALLRELARVRALENQCFLAAVNCAGPTGEYTFGGMSAIYDPVGRPVLECGPGEEIALADIDLAAVDKARAALPALKNYRRDIDWL